MDGNRLLSILTSGADNQCGQRTGFALFATLVKASTVFSVNFYMQHAPTAGKIRAKRLESALNAADAKVTWGRISQCITTGFGAGLRLKLNSFLSSPHSLTFTNCLLAFAERENIIVYGFNLRIF